MNKRISAIFCANGYQYPTEALQFLLKSPHKKIRFYLKEYNSILGLGEGIIFYTGSVPTKNQILSFMKRNMNKLHHQKLIGGLYSTHSKISRIEKL